MSFSEQTLAEYYATLEEVAKVHRVLPYLYLSGIQPLTNPKALEQLNVNTVISVCQPTQKQCNNVNTNKVRHIIFDVHDTGYDTEKLMKAAESIHEILLNEKEQQRTVLLHCAGGISRSVTVAAYHLMEIDRELTPEGVIEQIRSVRKCAEPNEFFFEALRLYHKNRPEVKCSVRVPFQMEK